MGPGGVVVQTMVDSCAHDTCFSFLQPFSRCKTACHIPADMLSAVLFWTRAFPATDNEFVVFKDVFRLPDYDTEACVCCPQDMLKRFMKQGSEHICPGIGYVSTHK